MRIIAPGTEELKRRGLDPKGDLLKKTPRTLAKKATKPKPVKGWFMADKKAKPGLYANIHAKKKRIAKGSGETMRKKGEKGAPTKKQFTRSAKTAKGK